MPKEPEPLRAKFSLGRGRRVAAFLFLGLVEPIRCNIVCAMPFNIGPGELILVLLIALVVIGPGKLPDVGHALGKSIREFRQATSDGSGPSASTTAPESAGSHKSPEADSDPAAG